MVIMTGFQKYTKTKSPTSPNLSIAPVGKARLSRENLAFASFSGQCPPKLASASGGGG
jgi:hypothetical protein